MAKKVKASPVNPIIVIDETGIIVMEKTSTNKIVTRGVASEEAFMQTIMANYPISTGLIPNELIYLDRKNTKEGVAHSLIYEFSPRVYGITFTDRVTKRNYRIRLPYIYFIIKILEKDGTKIIQAANILCSNTKAKTLTDICLYTLPMHNLSEGGAICWGAFKNDIDKTLSVYNYGFKLFETFWSLEFNTDLPIRKPSEVLSVVIPPENKDPILKSPEHVPYFKWELGTLKDPEFGKAFKINSAYTLGRYL